MTHRFPIKEIARQSGLGLATVDRVLNNRANVSPQTKGRVKAALAELELQEQQLAAKGRRMFVDVVVEAPKRFSKQIKSASERVLPSLSGAVFRPRFIFQEVMDDAEIISTLVRIKKRGSQGVFLKARDIPKVREMVNTLERSGIPVVTLVTDISSSNRSAYVGMDNSKAGRTAAYLLANLLNGSVGTILTSRSQEEFQGEAERFAYFKSTFLSLKPNFKVLEFIGGAGLPVLTKNKMDNELIDPKKIDAVYSMGGGNKAILEFLHSRRAFVKHFIAHDLDATNLDLLQSGAIDFVLHHDLLVDMRNAFQALLVRHGLVPPLETDLFSDVQIITPHNIPALRE